MTGRSERLLPIADILNLLGHKGRHVHILKIDCDGFEYAAFDNLRPEIQAGAISIGQIQVELHGLDFIQVASFFDGADKSGFMVFHKERNHWGCSGYQCLEFSLIHKSEAERMFGFTHCTLFK
jgi:hypothetical protein